MQQPHPRIDPAFPGSPATMALPVRSGERPSDLPELTDARRATLEANRPAPEALAYVLDALRAWRPDGTGAAQS